MLCLTCKNELTSKRTTKKFCDENCKQKYFRTKVSVTKIVPLSVMDVTVKKENVTLIPLSVTDVPVSVTPELEKKLSEIYKNFEKKYANRFRGFSGNIKIPDIKCVPHYVDGKRVLTEWEKSVLKGDIIYGKDEETQEAYVKVEEDHKDLVFTKETQAERIAIYKKEYENITYVPNWVLHGFNSKQEALKAAIKDVQKSVGVSNSGL